MCIILLFYITLCFSLFFPLMGAWLCHANIVQRVKSCYKIKIDYRVLDCCFYGVMPVSYTHLSISGNFTIEDTKDLANTLKSGRMPAPAHIVQDTLIKVWNRRDSWDTICLLYTSDIMSDAGASLCQQKKNIKNTRLHSRNCV